MKLKPSHTRALFLSAPTYTRFWRLPSRLLKDRLPSPKLRNSQEISHLRTGEMRVSNFELKIYGLSLSHFLYLSLSLMYYSLAHIKFAKVKARSFIQYCWISLSTLSLNRIGHRGIGTRETGGRQAISCNNWSERTVQCCGFLWQVYFFVFLFLSCRFYSDEIVFGWKFMLPPSKKFYYPL